MRGESLAGVRLPVTTRRRWRAWFARARERHRTATAERLEVIERLQRAEREARRYGSRRH